MSYGEGVTIYEVVDYSGLPTRPANPIQDNADALLVGQSLMQSRPAPAVHQRGWTPAIGRETN